MRHRALKFVEMAGILVVFLSGCATYTIPVDTFDNQTRAISSSSLKQQKIKLAMYGSKVFLVNSLDSIDVVTSDGHARKITNGPAVEIRLTSKNDRTKILFFDSIHREGRLIIGISARLPSVYDTLDIQQISKIEIQDGGKNYFYEN